MELKRIYHPYYLWEDFKSGFYDNCEPSLKSEKINKVVELLGNEQLTYKYMKYVVDNWEFSCQHNLTNCSLNRIAWLGQAAACVYYKIPNTVTMEAWSLLTKKQQDEADKIAAQLIEYWINKNKNVQLCNYYQAKT